MVIREKLTNRKVRLLGTAVGAVALVATMSGSPAQADQHQGADYPHPADVFVLNWEYIPSTVEISQGSQLKFGNYDAERGIPAHSLDEVVPGCTAPPYTGNNPGGPGCRYPRFSSGLTDHGQVHYVHGVEDLEPGSYQFTCQVHEFMKGTLVVK